MKQIDKGVGFSELASLISKQGQPQKRSYVAAAAHKDWLDACYGSEEIDQRNLLFQQVDG